jgi:hypothetical protein
VAFCEDLHAQLSLWIEAGDQIFVGLDANNDLHKGPVNDMFSSLHMKMQSEPNTLLGLRLRRATRAQTENQSMASISLADWTSKQVDIDLLMKDQKPTTE